jgi:LPXTG-motif cell wall-anchored protein
MYSSFGGRIKKLREKKAEEKRKEEQAKLEQDKLEQTEDKQDNNKIYLIAGAVAVLGAVIIIIKTRKK